MKKNLSARELDILLSYQFGSIDYVFPKLRLVSITLDEHPEIFFFVDGGLSEDDQESASLIDTYTGVAFSFGIEEGGYEVIRVDYPNPIPDYPGECVYARKEPTPQGPTEHFVLDDVTMDKRSKIHLALQRAMINRIFPQIRMIIVSFDDTFVNIRVTIDGELSQEDQANLDEMRTCFIEQIPRNELTRCDLTIERMDFPKKKRGGDGELVYYRKEYEANAPLHPYDVYGSLTPGIQRGIRQTTAEKFLCHKDGGAFVVSFQNWAYGRIFSQLRLVSMVRKGFSFELYFYVEGELSESDQKSIEEIRSNFGEDLYRRVVEKTSCKIIRVDSPDLILNYPGVCLFARKETPLLVHTKKVILDADIDFYYKALIAMQWALINRIFPQIRAVEIAVEGHSVIIQVIVYEDISAEEQATLEEMKACFIEQIPQGELENCTLELIRKPFSKDSPDFLDYLPETVYYSKANRQQLSGSR